MHQVAYPLLTLSPEAVERGLLLLPRPLGEGWGEGFHELPNQERRTTLGITSAKIVLARHGQTVSNRDDFIMGRSDARLTRHGIDEVKRISRIVGLESVQCVISSSLGRAALTAAIHSEQLRIPILFREAIAELSCGSWEGKPRANVIGGSGPIRGTWQFRPPGGESYQDAEPRVASLVAEILRMTDREAVLVMGHASVNRVFMKLWLDLAPEEAMNIRSPHDTIYVFERRRDVRYASGSGLSGNGFLVETK